MDNARFATVTAVNNGKRAARVQYDQMNIPSDWLPVLDSGDFFQAYDGPQVTEEEAGGAGDAAFESHKHDIVRLPYMPKVNDRVVVLMMTGDGPDGVILGSYQPWKG